MAKQAKRPQPPQEFSPGADPNSRNQLLSRRMGSVLGCAWLLVFILFDELWIGSLAFGIGFTVIFGLEVFYEKSKSWYSSFNLYVALICYLMTYAEYVHGFITGLMKIR